MRTDDFVRHRAWCRKATLSFGDELGCPSSCINRSRSLAGDRLLPLVYQELRKLAISKLPLQKLRRTFGPRLSFTTRGEDLWD